MGSAPALIGACFAWSGGASDVKMLNPSECGASEFYPVPRAGCRRGKFFPSMGCPIDWPRGLLRGLPHSFLGYEWIFEFQVSSKDTDVHLLKDLASLCFKNSRIPRPRWRWLRGLEKDGEGSDSAVWVASKNRGRSIIAGRGPDYPRVAPINASTLKTKNPPRRVEVFLLKTRGLPRSSIRDRGRSLFAEL